MPARKYETKSPTSPQLIRSDPPRSNYTRTVRTPLIEWLHEIANYPGEWFKYPESVTVGTSTRIKNHAIASMPAGDFEVTTRGDKESQSSRVWLWAKYIG